MVTTGNETLYVRSNLPAGTWAVQCTQKNGFSFLRDEIVFQRLTKGAIFGLEEGENIRSLCKSIRERCLDLGVRVGYEIRSSVEK